MKSNVAKRILSKTSTETKNRVRSMVNYMVRVKETNQAQKIWDKIDDMTEERVKQMRIEKEMREPIRNDWRDADTAPTHELIEVMDARGNIAKSTRSENGWLMKFDNFRDLKDMGTILVWRPLKK